MRTAKPAQKARQLVIRSLSKDTYNTNSLNNLGSTELRKKSKSGLEKREIEWKTYWAQDLFLMRQYIISQMKQFIRMSSCLSGQNEKRNVRGLWSNALFDESGPRCV